MKKTLLTVMMFTPLIANAGAVGTVSPKTADVTFAAPNSFNHTLTAATGLLAGNFANGTRQEVAKGQVSPAAESSPASYEVQFAVGAVNNFPQGNTAAEIKGNINPANKLMVGLSKDSSMDKNTTIESLNGENWLVYPSSNFFKYKITTTNTTIAADTYPITVNAAVFTP